MKAPPRSSWAPAAFTALATVTICSSFSTEQGPAIMAKWPPPIFTPSHSTTMSSGWNFRLQHLKGSDTRFTESTISRLLTRSMSTWLVSPTRPSTVWYSPTDRWMRSPRSWSQFISWSRLASVTPCFSTTIIFSSSVSFESLGSNVFKNKNAAQV